MHSDVKYPLQLSLHAPLLSSRLMETLDLSSYSSAECSHPELTYQLTSLVCHLGEHANSGHYVSYVRNSLNQVRNDAMSTVHGIM